MKSAAHLSVRCKPLQLNEKDTVSPCISVSLLLLAFPSEDSDSFAAEPGHQEKPKSGRKISSRFTMALQQPGTWEDSPKDWIHTGLMKSPEVLDVATNLQWTGLWFLTPRVTPVFIRLSTFERFISCIRKQPMNMYKHKRTLKQTYPLKHLLIDIEYPCQFYPIFQGVV